MRARPGGNLLHSNRQQSRGRVFDLTMADTGDAARRLRKNTAATVVSRDDLKQVGVSRYGHRKLQLRIIFIG